MLYIYPVIYTLVKHLKPFNESTEGEPIADKDLFDTIMNIAKDEGYIVSTPQQIDPWGKDKQWLFSIINLKAPCTNDEVVDHFGVRIPAGSHLRYTNPDASHDDEVYGALLDIAQNIARRLANIYDEVKVTKSIVHPSYFMDNMDAAATDEWGVRPYKGINFTITNYDSTDTSSLNENVDQELAIVSDITNIAKDAGYNVHMDNSDGYTSTLKYILTISDVDGRLIEDYKEFLEVCKDIKRRLEGHGFLDNSSIHFKCDSGFQHSPFVAFNFYQTAPRYVEGISWIRYWLNIGYKS